jgi:hypothetical protein
MQPTIKSSHTRPPGKKETLNNVQSGKIEDASPPVLYSLIMGDSGESFLPLTQSAKFIMNLVLE